MYTVFLTFLLCFHIHIFLIDIFQTSEIIIKSTPPIRKDLFRRKVWNGLISRKRLERNYFANACGRDLFRESVLKGLFPKPISEDLFGRV